MAKNNNKFINQADFNAWENFKNQKFLDGDKGEIFKKIKKNNKVKENIDFKVDLHGHSIEQSFKIIEKILNDCYEKNLRNILIITGKGLRSKVKENPYLSEDLNLLKYAIPNFIKDNFLDIISFIKEPDQSLGGAGAILLRLKKKL